MWKTVRKKFISAAKDGTVGIRKEAKIGLQEKNFRKGDHEGMDGQLRGGKNAGVLLDKSQEVLFIGIGEVFSDAQVNLLVVAMIQVGQIQGNEYG